MSRPSIIAALIAAVLAALLIAYVFTGGDGAQSDARPRCSSPQANDQIKHELFRRAAALRGTDRPAFDLVAGYAVVRMTPPVRRRSRGADAVDCFGSLVLELPPGVEVAGDRRSLAAKVQYVLRAGPDGRPQLKALSKADATLAVLSTLRRTETMDAEATSSATADPAADPPAAPPPAEPRAAAEAQRVGTPSAQPSAGAVEPLPATPARRSSPPPPPRRPRAQPSAPAPRPSATPSFNCRYARTRGEMAVCGDPGLASLDRQMSAQFYRALAVAGPAERGLLQRTRGRFLAHRDSCASRACMVDAYQGRIREIGDIIAGRWQP